MSDPIHPLTETHLESINKALEGIAKVKAQIELATRAGIDVAQYAVQAEKAEQQLRQIKQVYFPNRT